ncbi:hypothetical protein BS50DRAFT_568432 [Corynespora cassiicola Philippines]|uniref:Uncharacterized protein n=1 Tax=Corynespora cassiicola Philippines TaxID=1448308 RepID=A0A2T2P5Q6_CORCC|nr:hypothetical protein BS50DRAFT_568432 [Corynespora cassiicola Philippines]
MLWYVPTRLAMKAWPGRDLTWPIQDPISLEQELRLEHGHAPRCKLCEGLRRRTSHIQGVLLWANNKHLRFKPSRPAGPVAAVQWLPSFRRTVAAQACRTAPPPRDLPKLRQSLSIPLAQINTPDLERLTTNKYSVSHHRSLVGHPRARHTASLLPSPQTVPFDRVPDSSHHRSSGTTAHLASVGSQLLAKGAGSSPPRPSACTTASKTDSPPLEQSGTWHKP